MAIWGEADVHDGVPKCRQSSGWVREEKEEKERANGVASRRRGAVFLHAGLRRVAGPQWVLLKINLGGEGRIPPLYLCASSPPLSLPHCLPLRADDCPTTAPAHRVVPINYSSLDCTEAWGAAWKLGPNTYFNTICRTMHEPFSSCCKHLTSPVSSLFSSQLFPSCVTALQLSDLQ